MAEATKKQEETTGKKKKLTPRESLESAVYKIVRREVRGALSKLSEDELDGMVGRDVRGEPVDLAVLVEAQARESRTDEKPRDEESDDSTLHHAGGVVSS